MAEDVTQVCPRCGSDQLETQERVIVMYPVRFPTDWQRADGEAAPYTGERAGRTLDESAEWDGTVHCRGCCAWSGHWSELRKPMTRPAPQDRGHPHAYPAALERDTTCTGCGAEIYWDGWDEPDDFRDAWDLWTHAESGDYFCDRPSS